MATPLTDAIEALTTYANSVTGASDTTLSDAVYTLASGYGQGGGGYSDDPTDFSGGNILALISHKAEYINTGWYPKAYCEMYLKASKDTKYSTYEDYFATSFSASRIGIQADGSLTSCGWFATPERSVTIGNAMSTSPVVLCARNILAVDETATKPLVIFHGYYKGSLDQLGGYNFYGLKCYEFGQLVKHYAPWLDGNGVPCVHELVDDEYFYNVGSGSFDYIDADGNTVTTS